MARKRRHTDRPGEIRRRIDEVQATLIDHVLSKRRLAIVKAPPGSGKTHLLIETVRRAVKDGQRVAVATQTNAQADDICVRIGTAATGPTVIRFPSSQYAIPPALMQAGIPCESNWRQLPPKPCVVVGTSAKWGLVQLDPDQPAAAFDLCIVEEAWQLAWAEFMLLNQVASRFVLIGDPGQIPPVVPIDTSRWETAPRPPHVPAPQALLSNVPRDQRLELDLPATWRLPHDSTPLVRSFYDFEFDSIAAEGDRMLVAPTSGRARGARRVVVELQAGSTVAATLPTPDAGPPLELDEELATAAADLVSALLDGPATIRMRDLQSDAFVEQKLAPEHIGLAATHRVMTSALRLALPSALRDSIRIDTPERWQGLQLPLMIALHPLSGTIRPGPFDYETGRLCVMASRHQIGLILLSRDHIPDTLDHIVPSADQAIGRPDITGRGYWQHRHLWQTLATSHRVIAL